MLLYCILTSVVSDEKSAIVWIVFLYIMCCFSLGVFIFGNLVMMHTDCILWVCLVCRIPYFLNLWIYAFHQIWEVINCYFIQYIIWTILFFLHSKIHITEMLVLLIFSYSFLRLCSLCWNISVIYIDLSSKLLAITSFTCICYWVQPSDILILNVAYCIFKFKFFFWILIVFFVRT
jgi:hypothetical protein